MDDNWRDLVANDLFERLPVGRKYDQWSVREHGRVPVLDQSPDGYFGFHDDVPGVIASPECPVITFSNHRCYVRLHRTPFSVIQNVFPLRPKAGVDADFLFHALRRSVPVTEYKGHWDDFSRMRVRLPPLPTQRAIAHILGTLDDKIELNRRMNETLEAMARALFKSWFVDFDPVHAKSQGRPPAGMDAETAKLFPSEFVESELGPIPKGWQIRSLDSIAEFRNGLALQNFRPLENEPRLPAVKIAQLRTGKADSGEWARADILQSCILEDGDIVFSWSGSLTVVVWCGGRAALNQHLFRVTSMTSPKWFYLEWLLRHLEEFQRIASDKATTMGHIQRHHLTAAKCLVPSSAVLEEASRLFAPLLSKRIQLTLESRTLAQTRDALLPQLLSGQLQLDTVHSTGPT